ncbi:MAG: metallophosphoesterase [Victivallales bacterium]|jgi:predicted MPP superfamily phosphohydrolase|nr:metallophosphoesterase [Victivallales bacterium]
MLPVLGILFFGYVFCRVILPLRLHWSWKVCFSAILLLTAFKFQILHFVGGGMFFSPNLPVFVLMLMAWLFTILFFFFFLLGASDVVRIGIYLYVLTKKRHLTKRFRIIGNRVNLGLLIIAATLATIGIYAGTALPKVKEVTVKIENLPGNAEGMTIVLLADLHADGLTRQNRIRAIVERTNALKPDLIVITGDFVDGSVATRGKELLPLRELSAMYGVFGVPGNHEYYSGYSEWMKYLSTLGIQMLLNSHRTLPNGLVIAGVTDSTASRFGLETPDVARSLSGVPAESCKILIAHRPTLAHDAVEQGIDLQLSGHTHGGLIWGLDKFFASFNSGFSSGLYRVGEMQLYVSNGAGMWSGFPVRIGIPSEITLVRLASATSKKSH